MQEILTPEKSQYLEKLSSIPEINFNLYGPNLAKEVAEGENIHYFGSFPSDEVPNVIEGSYGLVWDSEKLEGGVGTYGNYQRYNNPHKTSLYIRCHLPIIIWSKAALAPFIKENKIGFCIDSLDQIDNLLLELRKEDYDEIRKNVIKISDKLSGGYYITTALNKILNQKENYK